MEKTLVIDARMIGPYGHGIAQYVRDLVFGLAAIPRREYRIALLVSKDLPLGDALRSFHCQDADAPFLHPKEWLEVPRLLRRLGADLFHSPSFCAFPSIPVPAVYTVHDLNHLHFGGFAQKTYYRFVLRRALKRAALVTSVSAFSRKELARWLGWEEEKILLAPNAIHALEIPANYAERLKALGLEKERFHFCLSNPKRHKNLGFLIKSYRRHRAQKPDAWPLVLSVTKSELPEADSDGVHALGPLSAQDAASLLATCGAFHFPSLYEGFGRPPLEAALFSRPLVVSKIPPHEEALAGVRNKLLLPPRDETAWAASFAAAEKGVLKNPSSEEIGALKERYSRSRLASTMHSAYQAVFAAARRR